MRVAVHRGQLRPGRPGGHLRDGDRAVGPGEPLHVRERVGDAQRLQRRRAPPVDALVPRAGDVAGQHDRPLDPRVAQDLQRRRAVVGDRRPHGRHRRCVTLSKVCSSPVRNSSSRAGESSLIGTAASQPRSMSPSSRRNVDCAPAPSGGLATSGNPTSSAKAMACPALRTRACRAHGIPAACSTSFICDLSRTLTRGAHVHALDAEGLADLRQRYLQLLERADQPVHPAHLPGEAAHRPGQLTRVERVVDPPVRVQPLAQGRRDAFHGLAGDEADPDVRQLRGDGDESRGGLQQVRRDEGGDDHGADRTPARSRAPPSLRGAGGGILASPT